MTSEEFAERFQKHPLGHCFQAMETAKTVHSIATGVGMAAGMIRLLEFQGEITQEEHDFLQEALQGNADRNKRRLEKTNSTGPQTRQ